VHLSHVSARIEGMTSSSPLATPAQHFEATNPVWHVLWCHTCDPDYGISYPTEGERDGAAFTHVPSGHVVELSIEPVPATEVPGKGAVWSGHEGGVRLRRDENGQFRWLYPTDGSVTWAGPYDTPQLALASWRGVYARATVQAPKQPTG
jgi:hypothetical protein